MAGNTLGEMAGNTLADAILHNFIRTHVLFLDASRDNICVVTEVSTLSVISVVSSG